MTLYAATTTSKGRSFYQSDRVTTLSLRRLVMLGVLQSKGWVKVATIAERIDIAYNNSSKQDKLELYPGWRTSEIYRDLFDLAKLEYVDIAMYKAPTGQLFTHKPHGMMFVDKG